LIVNPITVQREKEKTGEKEYMALPTAEKPNTNKGAPHSVYEDEKYEDSDYFVSSSDTDLGIGECPSMSLTETRLPDLDKNGSGKVIDEASSFINNDQEPFQHASNEHSSHGLDGSEMGMAKGGSELHRDDECKLTQPQEVVEPSSPNCCKNEVSSVPVIVQLIEEDHPPMEETVSQQVKQNAIFFLIMMTVHNWFMIGHIMRKVVAKPGRSCFMNYKKYIPFFINFSTLWTVYGMLQPDQIMVAHCMWRIY
jgi:hypothetical protein